MEMTKEQELEMLKKAGIEDVEKFLEDKKLVYANDDTRLIYEDKTKGLDLISFKYTGIVTIWGGTFTNICGDGHTNIYGNGYTEVRGDGYTEVDGKGTVRVTERGKE